MTTYCQPFGWPTFSNAGRYAQLVRTAQPDAVREAGLPGAVFPYTERHLRCVWHDSAYRPAPLRTNDGQAVTVENPGRWNLEAGPDFVDASLRLEPGHRHLRGDVEIHVYPAGWTHHAHAGDVRYRRVVAHVTYYPGDLPAEALPRGAIQIALRDALKANPSFAFESMDVTVYPYAAIAPSPPCARSLIGCSPEQRMALLEAAGEERLRRKAERMSVEAKEKGAEQVLYEEMMACLGY